MIAVHCSIKGEENLGNDSHVKVISAKFVNCAIIRHDQKAHILLVTMMVYQTKKYNEKLIITVNFELVNRVSCAGLCKKQHSSEQNKNECRQTMPVELSYHFISTLYLHICARVGMEALDTR